MSSTLRGDNPRFLKLSLDRKVSPRGLYQASRDRWLPQIANSFGLPAGVSCPGKTEFCTSCYAVSSERSNGVSDLVKHNLRLLQEAGTEDAMTDLIAEMVDRFARQADKAGVTGRERIFRIHWDGDFFSIDYASAWANVIRMFPSVQFWAYTRSFVEPVNVVPVLAGVANLELYLSADSWNIDAAKEVVSLYPEVRLAICSVDYKTGRELAPRKAIVCPENKGAMPLMKDGTGACVDCQLCPKGRADVIFSTSHEEDVSVVTRIAIRRTETTGVCANPECQAPLKKKPGPGRWPKWCSPRCRAQVYNRTARAS